MAITPLDTKLNQLDAFLKSDDAPPECMTLSDLDGFLTGIAVGPELIPQSEWFPVIWGDETVTFADETQANVVCDAIKDRYNEILREIDAGAPQPILWHTSDGATIASDWAKGFTQAMALRPALWKRLAESKIGGLLAPIKVLAADAAFEIKIDVHFPPNKQLQVMEKAVLSLPFTITFIYEYWHAPDSEKPTFTAKLQKAVRIAAEAQTSDKDH